MNPAAWPSSSNSGAWGATGVAARAAASAGYGSRTSPAIESSKPWNGSSSSTISDTRVSLLRTPPRLGYHKGQVVRVVTSREQRTHAADRVQRGGPDQRPSQSDLVGQ